MSSFWRAAVLRPRLSYAGSAAVLLAGLGLGVYLGHHEEAPAADNFSLPLPLPNAPPVVQPRAKSSRPTQPAAASDIAPIETLLPSNGVDFNTPSPLGTNL